MKRDIATWTRWLHIYLSMFSFIVILFFAITGITLNHPDWFGEQHRVTKYSGKMDPQWFETEHSIQTHKLEMVEYVRDSYHITMRFNDFSSDDSQCIISFKGPGSAADVYIDRSTGEFDLTNTSSGLVAIMNDLHKGRDTRNGWKWVIDITGLLMILVSLTGFIMIFFLKKKRRSGLLIVLFGGILTLLLYFLS